MNDTDLAFLGTHVIHGEKWGKKESLPEDDKTIISDKCHVRHYELMLEKNIAVGWRLHFSLLYIVCPTETRVSRHSSREKIKRRRQVEVQDVLMMATKLDREKDFLFIELWEKKCLKNLDSGDEPGITNDFISCSYTLPRPSSPLSLTLLCPTLVFDCLSYSLVTSCCEHYESLTYFSVFWHSKQNTSILNTKRPRRLSFSISSTTSFPSWVFVLLLWSSLFFVHLHSVTVLLHFSFLVSYTPRRSFSLSLVVLDVLHHLVSVGNIHSIDAPAKSLLKERKWE